jgi:hypothetical protein
MAHIAPFCRTRDVDQLHHLLDQLHNGPIRCSADIRAVTADSRAQTVVSAL